MIECGMTLRSFRIFCDAEGDLIAFVSANAVLVKKRIENVKFLYPFPVGLYCSIVGTPSDVLFLLRRCENLLFAFRNIDSKSNICYNSIKE